MLFTYFKKPKTKAVQLSFEDLFKDTVKTAPFINHPIAFRTIEIPEITNIDTAANIYNQIHNFKNRFEANLDYYIDRNMADYYTTYRIPKHNGGVRIINEPAEDLKLLMTNIRIYLESCAILPHTAAYAYVKHRTAKMAVEKHCKTKHTWYLKMDLHDFFGSCNPEFIKTSLQNIPFFYYMHPTVLDKFIHLCILNNGLPQGTPISPWLTNQIMIPFDFKMSNWCHEHNIVYTRYADDMIFSANSKEALKYAEEQVKQAVENTPLQINTAKTKYASVYGQNYILGLLANKEFTATIGNKKKERFRATLYDLAKNPTQWDATMASKFLGLIQYYTMIEPEWFNNCITKYERKYNVLYRDLLISIIKAN